MTAVLFLAAGLVAGLAGCALLACLGIDDFDAWAAGRTLGLVLVAFPAWWFGIFGMTGWRGLGVVLLVLLGAAGALVLIRRRVSWRELVRAEAIVIAAALVILVIRLDHPQIVGQEKPMDVGILATLLRSESFPPLDMWLAGERLPYYYWGALLWTTPLAASGLRLEIGYNLIVALVAGLAAVALWALGRRLGGSHRAGLTAAFFGVLAGTPDAWRQLLGGTGLRFLDIWRSSRQHEDAITEFPLFTEWLGDLHPHYLSIPIACAAFLVAWHVGQRRPRLAGIVVVTGLFGVAWAANPWCMPPTFAGIALLLLSADGRWHWPAGDGRWRWLAVAVVAVGGWLAAAPFHASFNPPFEGVRPVFAWTEPGVMLLYGGCLLVPALAAATALLWRRVGGDRRDRRLAVMLGTAAVVMVAAAASGRPSLVFLAAGVAVLVWVALSPGELAERPAIALAALGLFLFLVPEMVYVVDSYGERLHRMNTIFKAWIQGWILLAAALPVMLRLAWQRRWIRGTVLAVLVVAALPHLLWALLNQVSGRPLGLDGMAWLSAGDRAIVRFMREQPHDAAQIEAVGGAYSEYARLSANSGVPAYLGWENHELVWRGHGVTEETSRRAALVKELYTCADPARVRELANRAGCELVAIGALEQADFPAEGLDAVRAAGQLVLDVDGGQVVRIAGGGVLGAAPDPAGEAREADDG